MKIGGLRKSKRDGVVYLILFLSIYAFSGYAEVLAPGDDAERIDSFVRTQMDERGIPGMSMAIIAHGKIEQIRTFGQASIEFNLPVTQSTPFSVASITKSFTAVAIMTLVEARRLRLEDTIASHLNELPLGWRKVTVRQLLNHTSGLPDIVVNDYTIRTIAETSEGALRLLRNRPVGFPPGADWAYNQTNFMLLGMLIEKLSGKSYTQYIEERLFKPFGLPAPVFGDARTIIKQRATNYTPFRFGDTRPVRMDHAEVLNAEMAPIMYPAGGLNISIDGFARWLSALLNNKIISKDSLDTLWTPAKLSDGSIFQRPPRSSLWRGYGLGWVLGLEEPHPFVGGTGGLRAAFFVYPMDELAVIVLTNWQGSGPESLVAGIAGPYLTESPK